MFAAAGLARGTRVAVLAANQVQAWCATQAALASRMVTTSLHPLGSLDDLLFQLQDFSAELLVADGGSFGARAAELAQRHAGLKQVYTLADAEFGHSLAAAMDRVGHATLRDLSLTDDLAVVNYTGGTTGRSRGAMRRQAGLAAMVIEKLSDFDLPERPQYLTAVPGRSTWPPHR